MHLKLNVKLLEEITCRKRIFFYYFLLLSQKEIQTKLVLGVRQACDIPDNDDYVVG